MKRVKEHMKKAYRQRLERLNNSWVVIIQSAVAAGVAIWVATTLFGHESVFFAPMAAIIVIGVSGGDRMRRAVELNIGVTLGVGIGDLAISHFGNGPLQLSIFVLVALVAAIFLDASPLIGTQAAIGIVLIATIFPPGTNGGPDRMLDAFIGGFVSLIIIALVPNSPLRGAKQEIATILTIAGRVLGKVALSLEAHDTQGIRSALQEARGTQGNINKLISAAKTGKEAATVSPLHWRYRRRVKSLMRILNPVDNAMRNTRVLARRALVITEDKDTVSVEQVELLKKLAATMTTMGRLFRDGHKIGNSTAEVPETVKALRKLAAMSGSEMCEGRVLSAKMVLGQSRSIIVDLLQICGMTRKEAKATLAPTSDHPAEPPNMWTGQ